MNSGDKAHIPNLHDLRDSGMIEQVADCVYFVYIPERYGITQDEVTGGEPETGRKTIHKKKRVTDRPGLLRYRYNEVIPASRTIISGEDHDKDRNRTTESFIPYRRGDRRDGKTGTKGINYIGRCPFHEDHHPSLVVNPQKQTLDVLPAENMGM